MEVTVLASVTVVARHCDAIGALLHVERSISEYIDYSRCWTMARAAAGGHIALLRRLHAAEGNTKHGFSIRDVEQAMELAAQSGHLEVVQFLQVNYPQRGKTWSLELAASYGQLQVLKWLHEHGGGKDCLTMSAFDDAAENGHLEAVKWMHENRSEGCTTRAMDCAARSGRLDIVKWLHDHRKEGCTTQAMDWAAQAGHLDVVQWLHVNRREGCSTMAIDSAAANGHLELLCILFFFLSSLNFPHDVNRRPLQTQKEPRSSFSALPTEKKAELLAFRVQVTVLQKRLKELEDNAARIGPKPALDETQKRNLITVWTRRAELEKQLRLVAEAQNRQLKTVLARQTQAAKVVRKLLQNVTTVVAIEEGLRTPHPADSGLGRFVPNLDDAIYGALASRMGNMFLDADTVFAKVESKRFITDVVEVQMDPKTEIPYIELRATLPIPLSVKEMSVMVQRGKSYDPNRFKKHVVTKIGLKKESQVELHDPSMAMTVNLMSLARMYDDNNRSLSFWTSLVCDHPLNPSVRFQEQGWIMVSASPSNPQDSSVVQVCYRLSPDLQPGSIYSNLQHDTVTMTTFVLQNLGAVMRNNFLGMEILYSNLSNMSRLTQRPQC